MMCISLFSYGRPVVVRCIGWVWVGLGQLFGGLGWAGSIKIDPRTTLVWIQYTSVTKDRQRDTPADS